MHRHAHSILALSPLLLLAACGRGDETAAPADEATDEAPAVVAATPAAAVPVSYDCLPAQLLTVAYDNSGPTPMATLTLNGMTHQLTQVPAASGAKYATDSGRTAGKTLVWWSKGTDGTLLEGTVGGTEADETVIAECSPSA